MKIGGNAKHIALIQLAVKKVVDDFAEKLDRINVSFEENAFKMEIKVQTDKYGYTNAEFNFRPDIAAHIIPKKEKEDLFDTKWNSIFDSTWWIFEAETNPRNIFKNVVKMEAYRKIKGDSYGRQVYAFILVCWDDAVLPKNVEPFDQVWKFKRSE